MSGFNVGHLHISGVGTWDLEISNDEEFKQRIAEINAMLRFKHKVSDPQWETRKVGGGTPVQAPKPKRAPRKPALTGEEMQAATEPPVELQPVVREGSIAGEVDLAAARRLARS